MQEVATREEVSAALEDVLSRPEFGQRSSFLQDFLDGLDLGGLSMPSEGVLWSLLVLLLLLGGYLAWQIVRSSRPLHSRASDLGLPGRGPSVEERVRELRQRAAAARRAGEARLALRLSFFALVLGLGGRGDLAYRDAWTNRELLRRGQPSRAIRELLTPLVEELEAKDFGRERATEGDLDRLEALCESYLGPLAAGGGLA